MQLHVNDAPRESFEARDHTEMMWYVLRKWTTAEVWENGICRCRLPMVGYNFVVVAWTENGVNIYDVEGGVVNAYQSGTVRLV